MFCVRLPDEVYERLRSKAEARGMTPSALAREILDGDDGPRVIREGDYLAAAPKPPRKKSLAPLDLPPGEESFLDEPAECVHAWVTGVSGMTVCSKCHEPKGRR